MRPQDAAFLFLLFVVVPACVLGLVLLWDAARYGGWDE